MLRHATKLLPACAISFSLITAVWSEDKPSSDKPPASPTSHPETSLWMKKKLEYSQQILSGIAVADFEQIAAAAEQMRTLSKIEGFIRNRTPAYRTQLQMFQDANEEILQQAQNKNVDGAALAFTQMTFTCIQCHKHLRAQAAK